MNRSSWLDKDLEDNKARNLEVLRASTVPYRVGSGSELVAISGPGYPDIDFYPARNKWVIRGREMNGDASALLRFLDLRART